jgi:hypothetical protein
MSDLTQDKLVNYLMDRTDKFGNYISELAKQLGVAAEHVYGVLIRQQYTEAVGLFVQSGLYILIWIAIWITIAKFWKMAKRYNDGNGDESGLIAMTVVTIIGTIAFLFCFVDIIDDIKLATMKIINPEYYALKDIMDFIQSKVKK